MSFGNHRGLMLWLAPVCKGTRLQAKKGDEIPPLFMAPEQFLYVFVILDYNSLQHVKVAVSLVSFSQMQSNEVCGWWVSLVSEHSLFLILVRQVLPQSLQPDTLTPEVQSALCCLRVSLRCQCGLHGHSSSAHSQRKVVCFSSACTSVAWLKPCP